MFLRDLIQVVDPCQKYHRCDAEFFSLHPVGWYTISICSLSDDVYFSYLVKVMSIRHFHCKVTFFFIINKYLVERNFESI